MGNYSNMTKYPVFDNDKGEFLGILNIKGLVFSLLRDELDSENWKTYINKDTIFLTKNPKLSNALKILKNSPNHISVIKKGNLRDCHSKRYPWSISWKNSRWEIKLIFVVDIRKFSL